MLTFHMNTDALNSLRNEFDRIFDGVFEPFVFRGESSYPALNAWEDGDNLFVEAELPGLTMNDVEVLVAGDELTIKGRHPERNREHAYHRAERPSGEFSRSFRLPLPVNADGVQAALRDGVLTITLPKAESVKPRRITVKAAE